MAHLRSSDQGSREGPRVRSLRHCRGRHATRARAPARVARSRLRRRDGVHAQVGGDARRHPPLSADRAFGHRDRDELLRPGRGGTQLRHPDASRATRGATTITSCLSERLERARRVDARSAHDEPFDAAMFVDKHHVQERVYAHHAGLGWMAKNTCLIHPQYGSWFLLAGIARQPRTAAGRTDGRSVRRLHAVHRRVSDRRARRANASSTRRGASHISPSSSTATSRTDQRRAVGDHIYGCDICQDVCPWNLAPLATLDPAWQPRGGRDRATAAALWERSDFELHHAIRGSAMMRTPLSRLRRNLAVVLGNSGDDTAHRGAGAARAGRCRNAALSAETALVQRHVEWARQSLRSQAVAAPDAGAHPPEKPPQPAD